MNIKSFKNAHMGACVILGNGPSLNDVNLEDIVVPTFGTNRIYLKGGFVPTYYVAVNDLVINQFRNEINNVPTDKFLPSWEAENSHYGSVGSTTYIDTSLRFPMFSNPEGPIWEGHTVTFVCLQLAFYMGFKEVILLGLDHDYGPTLQPNLSVVATGPDQHHFSQGYFSGGVRWHTPDLRMSDLAYTLAREAYEADGRRIVNCSANTKCKIFPVVPFNYEMKSGKNKVSAIVSAYNAEKFVVGCMEDLARQTIARELEIVLVAQEDSKEVDLAMDVVAGDEDYPCDVRLIQTAKASTLVDIPTVYKAWNLGINSAQGKYITNANTDDRHHPMAYEIMCKVLDARPEIDLVYHDAFITWEENMIFEEFLKEYRTDPSTPLVGGRDPGKPGVFNWLDYSRETLINGCYIGPQPMWRANLHQKHGMFLEHWKSAGDYEFWLRCMGEDNYYHIPHILGLYCAREDGIELGDITTNMQEAAEAVVLHQSAEVEIRPTGPNHARVSVGGHYTNVVLDDLYNLVASITSEE